MDKKYDTSSPKRKAPRSNRGGCARKCHVLESMWNFFPFLLDFFLHGNLLFRLMGMKKAASFN